MSFPCPACKRTFETPGALQNHQRAKKHTKAKVKTAHARANGKVSNALVTTQFLAAREERAAAKGFPKAKWIGFCEDMMRLGLSVYLYEARVTVSKYVTVSDGARSFKVRFSNHRPIKAREASGDCDFFVGVCNQVTTTTDQAVNAVKNFFAMEVAP